MFGKIKYVLKKNLNMKTSYVVGLTVLSLFIIVGGISVALYTSQAESRGSLNIMTGDLISLLEGEELIDNQIRVEGNETKRITIALKNKNNKDAKFNLYYTPIDGVEIRSYSGLKPPTEEGIVLKPEEEKTYKVEIHNTKGEAQQITFGSDVGLSTKNLSFPRGKNIIDIGNDPNSDANSLYNIVKTQTKGTDEQIDFTHYIEPIDSGVFTRKETMEEVYPVYYYRGKVDNNLIFANFCWKIVRTTETGGVKLIYNGEKTDNKCLGTNPKVGTYAFNDNGDSPAYVGYMYGDVYASQERIGIAEAIYGNDVVWNGKEYTLQNTYHGSDSDQISSKYHYTCFSDSISCEKVYYVYYITEVKNEYYVTLANGKNVDEIWEDMMKNEHDSSAKREIDNWYENNLVEYTEKLEDTIFCNDRTVLSKSGWNKDGDAKLMVMFSAYLNLSLAYPPTKINLQCPERRDSFTVSEENGNGVLTYPVGLLTAYEATLAGSGRGSYSTDSYLSNIYGVYMTPMAYYYQFAAGCAMGDYRLDWPYVWRGSGGRPVISLKAGTLKISGNGTSDAPYLVNDDL